jgi:hypothetical protein
LQFDGKSDGKDLALTPSEFFYRQRFAAIDGKKI